jgi:hypothetical protein
MGFDLSKKPKAHTAALGVFRKMSTVDDLKKLGSLTDDELYREMFSATEGSQRFVQAKLELDRRNRVAVPPFPAGRDRPSRGQLPLKNRATTRRLLRLASWIMATAIVVRLVALLIVLVRGGSRGSDAPGALAAPTPSEQEAPPR